jgi:hypothetical protein
MSLKLPKSAEAAFRIEAFDAVEAGFAINVYGAGRNGWFVATYRSHGRDLDSGVRQLPKGESPTLLHLIDRCGFWSLPEDGSHLADPNVTVDDGDGLIIAGRNTVRYHEVRRFVWREPGLDAVVSFGRRVSGFFVRHPVYGFCLPPAEPEPKAVTPASQTPDAETGPAADRSGSG